MFCFEPYFGDFGRERERRFHHDGAAGDGEGFERVRIVVSGGFTAERIASFEAAGVPADAYGVGSSLLGGNTDFTADVVRVDGRPCAKEGRLYRPNDRLELVE